MPAFANRNKIALAVVLGVVSAPALAIPTFDISETTTNTGAANHIATVTMQNTAPASIAGFDFEISYDPALLTIATGDIVAADAVTNPGVTCQVPVAGTISCFANHPTAFYPGDVVINMAFDIGGTEVADPGTPLTFTSNSLTDNGGTGIPAAPAPDDGAIIITGVPVPTAPTITGAFVPNGAAAGNIGQTVNVGTIDLTVTAPATNGGSGSATCSDVAGGPVFTLAPASQPGLTTTVADVAVGCPLTDVAQAGQVQCVLVDGGTVTFDVTCPAGSAVPAPPTPLIVPASSFWSQLSLVGLLAALGLLVVAFRRNH